MVYVGRAVDHSNYNPCFPVHRNPPGLSALFTEHVQKHFTSRLSTELFALPAPFYKKRMYNQVQIDRTEVGDDAGMRGRAT